MLVLIQVSSIKINREASILALMGLPAGPFTRDVGTILFGWQSRFFETQPFGMHNTPTRTSVLIRRAASSCVSFRKVNGSCAFR
ncbi:hypothetical protein [Bradyrhizobium sp. 187]|uniref:hypothetical protein n=1 Tax=Bradyrhizobium sp. 187 TaxID=2782655 RepID=UPI001FFFFF0A|nr:hypothetical protein [Bradyrhizobium sp. 187]UPJ77190.1 hypothetical protein IVB19_38425 [Bradyrhizobium sp. 187]